MKTNNHLNNQCHKANHPAWHQIKNNPHDHKLTNYKSNNINQDIFNTKKIKICLNFKDKHNQKQTKNQPKFKKISNLVPIITVK